MGTTTQDIMDTRGVLQRLPVVNDGIVELTNEPGFGFEPDFTTFKTWRREVP